MVGTRPPESRASWKSELALLKIPSGARWGRSQEMASRATVPGAVAGELGLPLLAELRALSPSHSSSWVWG